MQNCNQKGQAVVGKRYHSIDSYKCPKYGQDIEKKQREDITIMVNLLS